MRERESDGVSERERASERESEREREREREFKGNRYEVISRDGKQTKRWDKREQVIKEKETREYHTMPNHKRVKFSLF